MEINRLAQPGTAATAPTPALAQLRVGQVLQVLVLKSTVDQVALLQVNNQQIKAQTKAPLVQGQLIETEVLQVEPRPILKLRTPLPANNPVAQLINTALKQALPKQSGLSPLLANLNALQTTQQHTRILPALVSNTIKTLLSNLPRRSQVTTAPGLKQALANSGLFMENKLAKPDSGNIRQDLKSSLLQLHTQATASRADRQAATTPGQAATSSRLPLVTIAASSPQAASPGTHIPLPQTSMPGAELLVPGPPQRPARPQAQGAQSATTSGMSDASLILGEVSKQAEGALARLKLLQLSSLPQQDSNNPQWILELPVQDQNRIDLFQLVIEEETDSDSAGDDNKWNIILSFDLDELGPMYVKLHYIDDKIATTVWAENDTTAAFIQDHLDELSRRYREAGVDSMNIQCHHGAPSETTLANASQTLLDIHA